MKKEFRDFDTRAREGGTWLDATAKTDRLPYEKVEMLVSDTGTIQKLTVIGRDQSVLSYAFTEERLNPLLSDAVFHFQIPAGAQVIDAVSFKGQEK